MARLTFTQIQQLWIKNGGTPGWAPLAAGIALAESGGTTGSLNNDPATGDYSVGLWQINYYGNLYTERASRYGKPATLQKSPTAQAKAAITLSQNGRTWTPWKTDRTWSAWQAAGAPAQPNASTVLQWVTSGFRTAGATLTSAITPAQAVAQGATIETNTAGVHPPKGTLVPTGGESWLDPSGTTWSVVTPSVVPGISATAPTTPSFGDTPFGDLATALRWTTSWGGWALMTTTVFLLGFVLLLVGVVLIGAVIFGPVAGSAGRLLPGPVGRATQALTPSARQRRRTSSATREAREITAQTRLATARAKRATRDAATRTAASVPRQAQRAPAGRRRHIASTERRVEPTRTIRV